MDFVTLILFLALYYLRPQEWFTAFNALRPIQLLSVLALWAMFQAGKLKPRDLVRTPLDWMVLCYFTWTLIAGWQFKHAFGMIEAVLLFYFVAVRSLDSIPRQKTFLGWWCAFILIIAALAVAGQFGFDPLGSHDVTEGQMKGRLILRLSIFNNPNTLAHSIIPAVPLIYYLIYWRRVAIKGAVILLAIPLYCIFLTQSKGAFICGFATLLATLTFGRSKVGQIVILILAVCFGYGALFALPRMNELSHAKGDQAIQGRVAALSFGLQSMRHNFFGLGLGNFKPMFFRFGPLEEVVSTKIIPAHEIADGAGYMHRISALHLPKRKFHHYTKAGHGSYNSNGAELGYVGLFLFVGILYCCIRTLLLVKSKDDDEERIRRALFAMVVAYAVSSWMVDFAYRPTFLLLVAAISAFHRHLLQKHAEAGQPVKDVPVVPGHPWLRRLPPIKIPGIPLPGLGASIPASSAACLPSEIPSPLLASSALEPAPALVSAAAHGGSRVLAWHKPHASIEEALRKKFIWTRLNIWDYLIILALFYATIRFWEHLIATM